jgi:hypothetical protein
MFEALQNCDLTVQVSTKLNRSHIVHGRQALILPSAEDYDRIRDTAAQVPDGFEDFNARVRHPHGFRISQPARERGFLTPFGRADFGLGPLPDDIDPGQGWLSEQRTRNVHRAGPRDGRRTREVSMTSDTGGSPPAKRWRGLLGRDRDQYESELGGPDPDDGDEPGPERP